jgi:hypothetical protein
MLAVSTRTLYAHTDPRGDLPVVRLPGGRACLYRVADLEAWLARHAGASSDDTADDGGQADAE